MKTISYLLILLLFLSCKKETDFDWLTGNWERTNDDKEYKTYESWSKKTNKEYVGMGCTLKNSDTAFKESLRLININGIWNYEVVGVNETPTTFLFTEQTSTSFSCENKQNEFPKKIAYSLKGNTLKAVISDETREIPFIFKKKSP